MADKTEGKGKAKHRRSRKPTARRRIDTPSSSTKKRRAGNPGYAGYLYQIEVTIWIALDLLLAKAGTDELTIEPPSQEDIEASVEEPDKVLLGLTAQTSHIDLLFQVKTRSGAPWTSRGFAKILTGRQHEDGRGGRGRMRPLDMLAENHHRRYVFITNETLCRSLRVHQGEHIFDFPEVTELPPYSREGYDSAAQEELAPRILLCGGVTEEVLESRIERLLARYGHVPSINRVACLKNLRENIHKRIRGHADGRWTRVELIEALARHGGSVAPTRAMDHYVRPRSFELIQEKLQKSHAVVISGPSGTGKTLTADILESVLRRSDPPFQVVGEEHGPGHVRHYLTEAGAILFHLRDPWGENRLTPGADRWSGELPKLLNGGGPEKKFLITSRSDVLQSAGLALTKDLEPYIVSIEVEDYGLERLQQIYDGIANDLSGHARSLARAYRQTALKSLHRPYEIDRFLVALSREDAKKPRKCEDLVADSQIDAISGVIARQIEPLGDDGVVSAAVIWALLVARGVVNRDVFAKLLRRMRAADNSFRPDVEGLLDFLVAGRNLRQDGASLSFYHPRVEDGLRMTFMKRQTEAEHVLSRMTDGLADLDSGKEDWGIETGLAVLRATAKLNGLESTLARATQERLDDHLEANAMAADRHFDFERALHDLARFGSADHPPSLLARALISATKEVAFPKQWRPPALSEEEIKELKNDARTRPLIERFVREVMPFTQTKYDPAVISLLLQLAPGIDVAFWDALDTVAGPGGPNENIEAIVAGACAGALPDFDRAIARFARSEAEADSWMEEEYAERGRQAEEHEVNAVAADNILEEPQEMYYNAQSGMKAVMRLRWSHEGLDWLTDHPHRQSLISAAADLIYKSHVTPRPGELQHLLELAEPWARAEVWRAAKQHWQTDLADMFTAELAKSGLSNGLRGTLIEIAAQISILSGDPVPLLSNFSHHISTERQLELVYDLMRTKLDKKRRKTSNVAQRARAENLCDALDNSLGEVGRLLTALMSGEEIKSSAQKLSKPAQVRLASLLPTLPLDVVGPLLCAAAAIGIDIVATAERLLKDGAADAGVAAVQALVISRNSTVLTVLHKAFGHERYPVRRAALEALVQLGVPQDRDRILGAANDKSADIRLAWARLMQECRWPEAVGALVKLLSDERNFSSDPGYLRGPTWSAFRVARAAAQALGAYESLPESAVGALLQAAKRKSRDPFVACAAMLSLADKDDGRISDAIALALNSVGLEGASQYRPLAQAGAWSLFDRVVAKKPVDFGPDATRMAAEDSPIIAGPLLLAAGILGGESRETLVRYLNDPDLVTRAELVRVAAIADGGDADLALEGCEPILAKLATGDAFENLASEERSNLEAWSRNLDPECDVQRFTAWVANSVFKLPVPDNVGDPRVFDLPQRIGLLTMRSLSPAREEYRGADDGT